MRAAHRLDGGGLLGAISCGPIADAACRRFGCSRGAFAQLYSIAAVFAVAALWRVTTLQNHHWGYTSLSFFLIGIFVYSPKVTCWCASLKPNPKQTHFAQGQYEKSAWS